MQIVEWEGKMPIAESDVVVGKCYATPTNQNRRVVVIDDGKVTYESWGGNVMNTSAPLHRNTVKIETFADAVEKETPCDPSLPLMPSLGE